MTTTSHRTRLALLALLILSLEFLLFTRPAHGGWSTEPVQVHATTALCPLVSASDDAHYGAIVVWQENTASGGILRARRLLASGDLDPGWSVPTTVSTADVARTALGSVSDGTGGAYVWWMEVRQLYVTRVAAGGTVAAGWPARGRAIGTLLESGLRPTAFADAGGGLYLAWLAGDSFFPTFGIVRAIHLGPDNTGRDGWPNVPLTLGDLSSLSEAVNAFGAGMAGDGGLWVAVATTSVAGETPAPGHARLLRFTAAGVPSPAWTSEGVELATFQGQLLEADPNWRLVPRMGLVAVTGDGATGAFVVQGSPTTSEYYTSLHAEYRLQHVGADGSPSAGWPVDGLLLNSIAFGDAGADASARAIADGVGGVHVGLPAFYDHGISYGLQRYTSAGSALNDIVGTGVGGIESAPRGDGGVLAASFHPTTQLGLYAPSAYLQVAQSAPGAGFSEWQAEPIQWYGDIGLAATGDGGSIFAWSQVEGREGVFAVRLNPSGIVTGVPPGSAVQRLRLWFARGSGVQVEAPAGLVSLALHDVTGRVAARGTSDAPGRWTLPGTAGLPSGVYFAHAKWSDRETHARVVVIR